MPCAFSTSHTWLQHTLQHLYQQDSSSGLLNIAAESSTPFLHPSIHATRKLFDGEIHLASDNQSLHQMVAHMCAMPTIEDWIAHSFAVHPRQPHRSATSILVWQGFTYLFMVIYHFMRWPYAIPVTETLTFACTFISGWIA